MNFLICKSRFETLITFAEGHFKNVSMRYKTNIDCPWINDLVTHCSYVISNIFSHSSRFLVGWTLMVKIIFQHFCTESKFKYGV